MRKMILPSLCLSSIAVCVGAIQTPLLERSLLASRRSTRENADEDPGSVSKSVQFVVNHLPKCAGLYLRDVLTKRGVPLLKFEREQDSVEESDHEDFVVGMVRNPLDYYVSHWAFVSIGDFSDEDPPHTYLKTNFPEVLSSCEEALNYAVGDTGTNGCASYLTSDECRSIARENGKWFNRVDSWSEYPKGCFWNHDDQFFYNNHSSGAPNSDPGAQPVCKQDGCVLGSTSKQKAAFNRFVRTVCTETLGQLSLRFWGSYVGSPANGNFHNVPIVQDYLNDMYKNAYHDGDLHRTIQEELGKLTSLDKVKVDCWIRQENVEADMIKCLKMYEKVPGHGQLDWQTLQKKMNSNATYDNSSPHAHCKDLYEEETLKLVAKADKHLFDLFGYEPHCPS